VGGTEDPRRLELAANLRDVRDRIAAACARSGRDPDGVTLVAVTKTWPAADVVRLAGLGVADIGENRDQEAAPKAAQVAAAGARVRWHFVGQLQRNKCRSVVTYADMVHSVDGVRLARALAEASRRHRNSAPGDAAAGDRAAGDQAAGDRMLDVLVQVSIDGDPTRGGAVAGSTDPDRELEQVVAAVAEADVLRLRGVMAVAPLEWEPARAYELLAELAGRIRAQHPAADVISAGMSGDIEEAIDYGATHVRMGTALLGMRPTLM